MHDEVSHGSGCLVPCVIMRVPADFVDMMRSMQPMDLRSIIQVGGQMDAPHIDKLIDRTQAYPDRTRV